MTGTMASNQESKQLSDGNERKQEFLELQQTGISKTKTGISKTKTGVSEIGYYGEELNYGMTFRTMIIFGVFLTVLIVGGILAIHFVWKEAAENSVVTSLDKMSVELHTGTHAIVTDVFSAPEIVAAVGEVAVRLGEVPVNEDGAWQTGSDQYFLELIDQYRVSGIYIGSKFNGGEMAGTFIKDGTKTVKSTTGECLTTYNVDDSGLQRAGEISDTERCPYNTTGRLWYMGAEEIYYQNLDVRGQWTDVYFFADLSPGISYSVPLVRQDEFIGVFAVDLTLDYLSEFLDQAKIPFNGVGYIANKETEVLASSIFDVDVPKREDGVEIIAEDRRIFSSIRYIRSQNSFDSNVTIPVLNHLVDDEYLTSAEHLLETPGIDVFSVSVFPSKNYLQNSVTATIITWVLCAVAVVAGAAFAWLAFTTSNIPKNLPKGDVRTTKRKRYNILLRCSVALIVMILFLIWLSWNLLSQKSTTRLIETLLQQTQERVKRRTVDYVKHSQTVISVMKNKYNRGPNVWDYYLTMADRSDDETYDRYICGLADSLRAHDGETHLVHGVYMGFPNGQTHGCFRRSAKGAPSFLAISVEDDTTNFCRRRYNITSDMHRDQSADWPDDEGCDYVPADRPWYITAVNLTDETTRDKPVWTRPYTFSDGSVGVTAVQSFWDDDGTGGYTFAGVFAVDVLLDDLSVFLSSIQVGLTAEEVLSEGRSEGGDVPDEDDEIRVFVLERTMDPRKSDYNFVASSTLSITEYLFDTSGKGFQDVVTALNIEDENVAETLQFLTQKDGTSEHSPAWEDIGDGVFIPRRTVDPMTLVVGLTGEESYGVDWIIVLTVPPEEFWGAIDRNNRMALLAGIGAALVILYIMRIAYKFIKSGHEKTIKATNIQKLCGQPNIDEVGAQKLLNTVMNCNVTPRSTTGRCKHLNDRLTAENIGIEASGICQFCEERGVEHGDAMKHMEFASTGFNNLAYFRLVSKGKTPALLFEITRNRIYVVVIHIIVFAHIALSFWKPHNPTEVSRNGFETLPTVLEWILFLIETADLGVGFLFLRELKDFRGDDFLDEPALQTIFTARCVLDFLIFIDLILMSAVPFSFEYYVPLRWLILLLLNQTLRRSAYAFSMAVVKARDVLLMYVCLIFVCATMMLVLFRCTPATIESGDCDPNEFSDSSKSNFLFAFVTAFIYISTGENYASVANEGVGIDKWNILFFAAFTVFGMFFVMALVAGFFEMDFEDARSTERRFYKLVERTGTISAFLVLADDRPDDGEIKQDDTRKSVAHYDLQKIYITIPKYNAFLKYCGTLAPVVESGQEKHRKKRKLDAFEFLTHVEEIEVKKLILDRQKKELRIGNIDAPGTWDDKLRELFNTDAWRQVVLAIVFVYMWLLTLYGTASDEKALDVIIGLFIIIQTAEILFRFIVFGGDFWNWAYYPKHWNPPFESPLENVIIEGKPLPLRLFPKFTSLQDAQEAALNTDACQGIVRVPATGRIGSWEFRLMESRKLIEGEEGTATWLKPLQSAAIRTQKLKQAKHQMFANQLEVVIVFITFVFWAITHGIDGSLYYSEESSSFRFVTTLPILRVFTQIHKTRTIVFTLFGVLPTFGSIFVLLMMVFYIYGFYGMSNFSGKFELYDLEGIPDAHFETLMSSIITLFQFLVGDSLDTLERVIEVTTHNSIFYFLTFTVLVVVLFANLFFGLILGTVADIIEESKGDSILDGDSVPEEEEEDEPADDGVGENFPEKVKEIYKTMQQQSWNLPQYSDTSSALMSIRDSLKQYAEQEYTDAPEEHGVHWSNSRSGEFSDGGSPVAAVQYPQELEEEEEFQKEQDFEDHENSPTHVQGHEDYSYDQNDAHSDDSDFNDEQHPPAHDM